MFGPVEPPFIKTCSYATGTCVCMLHVHILILPQHVCMQCAGIYVGFQEENGAKRAIDGLSQKVGSGGNPQICGADTRVLEGKNLSICCVVGIN